MNTPLPVIPTTPLESPALSKAPHVRRSMGRWRALSFILVYCAAACHILHWKLSGKTLAPLELSEVMYTMELGIITAGFLFMAMLVFGTFIFGRFFCGWGCHILALQELCAWILRKLHIRRKPIRSRLLLWVPPLTAFYMFGLPQVVRAWESRAIPTFHFRTDADGWASMTTTHFWRNLPSAPIIVLTFLVCGFVIVYLLGSRTFCTYVCPFGAVFSLADRFTPGKIIGSDACKQCGTCTAICESGIRVHDEIRQFGMVVNPACLKDLDCVVGCPNDVLRYGITTPALWKSSRGSGRFGLPYGFTLAEEHFMAAVCLVTMFCLRGLYSRIPFLLSVASGGIVGYLSVIGWRLTQSTNVMLTHHRLKISGRLSRSGIIFSCCYALVIALLAHSGFVRYHEYNGLKMTKSMPHVSPVENRPLMATRALEHLVTAYDWGLFSNERVQRSMLSTLMYLERFDEAEPVAEALLKIRPDEMDLNMRFGQVLAGQNRPIEAARQFVRVIEGANPDDEQATSTVASACFALGTIRTSQGNFSEAIALFGRTIKLEPAWGQAHAAYGSALAELGKLEGAVTSLQQASQLAPNLPQVQYNLGTILGYLGRFEEAVPCLEKALDEAPDDADLCNNLGFALIRLGQWDRARRHLVRAISLAPSHAGAHYNLAMLFYSVGDDAQAQRHESEAVRLDPRYARSSSK